MRKAILLMGFVFLFSISTKCQNIKISHLEVMLSLMNEEVSEILGDDYEYLGEQARGSKTINMWLYKTDGNSGISRISERTTQYIVFVTKNYSLYKELKEYVKLKYPNISKTDSNLYHNKYKDILYKFAKQTLPNNDYGYTVTVSDSFSKQE